MNEVMMNELEIENMIYEIRGKQVMLDSDLAKLYQCKNGTKTINLSVKRNVERFPEDFYFQLTKEEYNNLKFQFETSSYGGVRKMPYVFTEQGVAMLSSVLRTEVASKVSVDIMRAFVIMRKYISNELLEQKYINNLVLRNNDKLICLDDKVLLLQETFNMLQNKELTNEIYFEGQIYDAYSKILDIMSNAKEEIIIIDNYADKIVLDMISRMKVKVTLITKKNNLLSNVDIEKYDKQYNNLIVKYDNTFHDRYIILDNSIVYHCGASLNYIGNKTFSINKIVEKEVVNLLVNKIIGIK